MSYRDFKYPKVIDDLGLTVGEADFTSDIPRVLVRKELASMLEKGAHLSLGVNTEKARSEFIVAPLLLETRELTDGGFGIFSGIEFNVDPAQGLNGVCDFLLTRPAMIYLMTTPLVVVVEVKNDTINDAYGQCIAAMRAAQIRNKQKGLDFPIHGVMTTGSDWKFLRLVADVLTFDSPNYYLTDPGKIIAIIKHMIESVPLASAAA